MIKRGTIAALGLILILGLCACRNREEEKRQQQLQLQLDLIGRQFQEFDAGRGELQDRATRLQQLLAEADAELDAAQPPVVGAQAAVAKLRDLTILRYSPRHSRWAGAGLKVILYLALFLLLVWAIWRARQRRLERAMNAEINRVIERLEREAVPSRGPGPSAGPDRLSPPTPAHPPAADQAKPREEARETTAKKDRRRPAPVEKAPTVEIKSGPTPAQEPKKIVAAAAKETGKEAEAPKKEPKPGQPARKETGKTKAPARKPDKNDARKKIARRAPTKKCKVKGCQNKHRSKGFCNKHYQQWRNGILKEAIEED